MINRGYAVVVAMAASRPPAWPAWLHRQAPPFWQGSASRELRVTGAIKEKESLPLMQGFYAKAAGELAEALKGASAPPSPPAKN